MLLVRSYILEGMYGKVFRSQDVLEQRVLSNEHRQILAVSQSGSCEVWGRAQHKCFAVGNSIFLSSSHL